MACQICLEDFEVILSETATISTTTTTKVARVQQLCNESTCSADICSLCLTTHIKTTLDSCATGLLPRVKCPICLVAINKSKWDPFVSSTVVKYAYGARAYAVASFESPCCNNAEYSHLPGATVSVALSSQELIEHGSAYLQDQAHLPALVELLGGFMDHAVGAAQVMAYITTHIDDESNLDALMYESVLPRVYDEERRASLLLAYLYQFPVTYTSCCEEMVCFNCKRVHDTDDPCDDEEEGFDIDTCVVRCRECRVMLVKTEGCDTVRCQCGFHMNWPNELKYRNMSKRSLLPVDLYDGESMELFRLRTAMIEAHYRPAFNAWRVKHVGKLIETNRAPLKKLLTKSPWRQRRLQVPVSVPVSPVESSEGPVL